MSPINTDMLTQERYFIKTLPYYHKIYILKYKTLSCSFYNVYIFQSFFKVKANIQQSISSMNITGTPTQKEETPATA